MCGAASGTQDRVIAPATEAGRPRGTDHVDDSRTLPDRGDRVPPPPAGGAVRPRRRARPRPSPALGAAPPLLDPAAVAAPATVRGVSTAAPESRRAVSVGSAMMGDVAALADETPILGRDRELALLTDLVGLDGQTRARSVLLVGDAGVGKTRTLRELVRRARGAGWQTLVGHCLDFGDSALPYL